MSLPPLEPGPPTALAPSVVSPGYPRLAWLVIVAVVAFLIWRNETLPPSQNPSVESAAMRMQGRILVGIAQLTGDKTQTYGQTRLLNQGSLSRRLRLAVLVGELAGPDQARQMLATLGDKIQAGQLDAQDTEVELLQLLYHIYRAEEKHPGEMPSLTTDQRKMLRANLGWFGDLALAPAHGPDNAARERVLQPARRAAGGFLAVTDSWLFLGLLGLLPLILLSVLLLAGRLPGLGANRTGRSGIYAETFAAYLLLYVALSYGFSYVPVGQFRLAIASLASLGSLLALAWPVLRGISWRQVCQDIGWTVGRNPGVEPLLGIGCYAMALSLSLVGILIILILLGLGQLLGFGPPRPPEHPIIGWVANVNGWQWLQVVFVASVVAPVVEETMFRGVLYRHLRDATLRGGRSFSIVLSVLVVSFVFAVIHPQGLLGIPVLMGLATSFALMREWRGTLIPSMVAHGVNNALAVLLLYLAVI